MAATNHYERKRREQERILRQLERRNDKNGAPQRQYAEDMANIQMLVREGVIDAAHADILAANVAGKLVAHNTKKNAGNVRAKLVAEASRKAIAWFMLVVIGSVIFTIVMFKQLFG
jgi:hypothetical protein